MPAGRSHTTRGLTRRKSTNVDWRRTNFGKAVAVRPVLPVAYPKPGWSGAPAAVQPGIEAAIEVLGG